MARVTRLELATSGVTVRKKPMREVLRGRYSGKYGYRVPTDSLEKVQTKCKHLGYFFMSNKFLRFA